MRYTFNYYVHRPSMTKNIKVRRQDRMGSSTRWVLGEMMKMGNCKAILVTSNIQLAKKPLRKNVAVLSYLWKAMTLHCPSSYDLIGFDKWQWQTTQLLASQFGDKWYQSTASNGFVACIVCLPYTRATGCP